MGGNPWDSLTYGANAAVRNINDLYGTVSARNIQQQTENRLAVTSEIENKKKQFELQKAQEQEADNNRTIDITTHPAYLALPDKIQSELIQDFASQGILDATGKGRKIDILNGVKAIEQTKPLFTRYMAPVIEQKKAQVVEAYGMYQEALAKGDQKKAQEALANYNKLNMDYQSSTDSFSKHLEALDKNATELQKASLPVKPNPETERHNKVMEKLGAQRNVIAATKTEKEKAPSESNARLLEKSVVDAEAKILSNPDAPETEAYVSFYNKNNPDYSYEKQEVPGTIWGTNSKWVKVAKTGGNTTQPKTKSLKPDGKGGFIYQ
jgi:hypothetical protein